MSTRLTSGIELIPIEEMWDSIWEINTTKTIGDTLARVYPGYQWWVRAHAKRGYFMIHCGEINSAMTTNLPYGMLLHVSKIDDHGLLRKKVIRMGGEFLERASLERGRNRGFAPTRVDGLPEKHQPSQLFAA
jgi:hypothetical protein